MSLRLVQRAVLLALLALLAGCSSVLGPGVAVTQTNGQMAPLVSDTGDPEDDIIGARENPKIIASYGGIYSDRNAEIMLAQIVSKLLSAADQPNTKFTVTVLDSPDRQRLRAARRLHLCDARHPGARQRPERAGGGAGARDLARHPQARAGAHQPHQDDGLVDKVVTGVFGGDPSTDQSANKAQLSLAAFSQAQELAADKSGIKIAGKAGYDPLRRGALPQRHGPLRAVYVRAMPTRATTSCRRIPRRPTASRRRPRSPAASSAHPASASRTGRTTWRRSTAWSMATAPTRAPSAASASSIRR